MDVSLDTILLAVGPKDDDRLDHLARAILQVTVPTDATVVITHVFTPEQFKSVADDLGVPDIGVDEVDTVLERHATIRHFESVFDDYDVDYELRGVVGEISGGILNIAEATDADRVVISGRSRSAVGKAMFGSTAQDVLLNAPCPVTFVRGDS